MPAQHQAKNAAEHDPQRLYQRRLDAPGAQRQQPGLPLIARQADLLGLQRTLGNRAVQRLLAAQQPTGGPPIQRYFQLKQAAYVGLGVAKAESTQFPGHNQDDEHEDFLKEDKTPNRVALDTIPDLMVSDDGEMAIESSAVGGNREVEAFFASDTVINAGNASLKTTGSAFNLKKIGGQTLTVPDMKTTTRHSLFKVEGQKAGGIYIFSSRPSGPSLIGKEQCIEMAEEIMNTKAPKIQLNTESEETVGFNQRNIAQQMLTYLATYIQEKKGGKDPDVCEAAAKDAIENEKPPVIDPGSWNSPQFNVITASQAAMTEFGKKLAAASQKARRDNNEDKKMFTPIFNFNVGDIKQREGVEEEEWEKPFGVLDEGYALTYDTILNVGDVKAQYKRVETLDSTSVKRPITPELATEALENQKKAVQKVLTDNPDILAEVNKKLGMNEYANPEIGQAYETFHKGDGSEATFPYHYAGVVAKSGVDTVTFENYAREKKSSEGSQGNDQRMYFQMYGPEREVTVGDGQVRHVAKDTEEEQQQQEKGEYERGSFHGKWKGIFEDAQTVAVGK